MLNIVCFFEDAGRILALPSPSRPRLFISLGTVRSRWRDSASYYPAFKWRARLFKLYLRGSVTLFPGFFRMPDQHVFNAPVVSEDFPYTHSLLKKKIEGFDRCVVMLGATDDRRRKAIICLKDKDGVPLAYVKQAVREQAMEKVNNEIHMLKALPPSVRPELMGWWDSKESAAVCISAVKGIALSNFLAAPDDSDYWDPILDFLKHLKTTKEAVPALQHPWIMALSAQAPVNLADWLLPLKGAAWPIVLLHGDFTPWNLIRNGDGHLIAIDWEDGREEGFVWVDLIYYVIQTGTLMHHWNSTKIRTYLIKMFRARGVEDVVASALIRLAALEAFLKGKNDGSPENGRLQITKKELWEIV